VGVDLLGVDLVRGGVEQAALDAWAADGVSYIRKVPQERLTNLAKRVSEAVAKGERWETMREDIRAELGVGERHLELIARDQVAKLNGRITQALQEAAGVTSYRWRAARDERVRATHRAVDGQVFTWASGGPPGVAFYGGRAHPGQAGQCRCTAEPVVDPSEWG
jgi:SPP1 gp7 family putative phage head morphogenesis protein